MNGRTNSSGTTINDLEIPLDPPSNLDSTAAYAQVSLTWTDPKNKYATPEGEAMEDTDQLVSIWAYTRIVRKVGSAPIGPNDGTIVLESAVRDQYKTTPYIDTNLTNDITYYYGAFSYNENGVVSSGAFTSATPISRPEYYGVFGVQWDTSNSSTVLTRLTIENDPNHFVDHNITTEPIASIDGSAGSSPFDAFSPWKDMEEYNIIDGQALYKQGDPGFSRSKYETMVWVPKFWYYIEQSGKLIRYYISSDEQPGFEKHPGSGRYMARYITNTNISSMGTGSPLTQLTRATARTSASSKGSGWQQDDYTAWCARNLLYLVEFADFNSQKKLGYGNLDTRSNVDIGYTDSMTYHTGTPVEFMYNSAVQYRHIENPWSRISTFVDGINFNNEHVWVCDDPSKYNDETSNGYINIGNIILDNGFIRKMDVSTIAPWAMIPTQVGGSNSTYIPDNHYYDTEFGREEWTAMVIGGLTMNDLEAGLWDFDSWYNSSETGSRLGFRLIWDPVRA